MLQAYGDQRSFLGKFTPDLQITVAKHEKRAFLGKAPSLGLIKATYGENTAVMWLMPQIWDLCEYTNSRGKLNEIQAKNLAEMISVEYGYMKVTEIMLFFHRLKCGRYGKFYGVVDPMAIMMALDEFRKERNEFLMVNKPKEKDDGVKRISADEFFKKRGIPENEQRMIKKIINNFQ